MKNPGMVLILPLALALMYCTSKEPTAATTQFVSLENTSLSSTSELKIPLRDLSERGSLPTSKEIVIQHDPVFKKTKKYIGFSLQYLLDSIITTQQFDTTDAIIAFECTDGYNATMPLSKVFTDKPGFIALRDLEAPTGKNWLDSLEHKMRPFYLVWQNVNPDDHDYAWPYGLATIRIIPASAAYKDAYPFAAPEHVEGFQLFSQNCMKCHAVNKTGGTMAPEFNIPRNITEYWTAENIIAFAKSPQSFRINSTMPPVTHLSDNELNKIVSYLKYIANHKIEL
ncbi:MAG: c-type cytochrome [Saprospiraceae bacterium]